MRTIDYAISRLCSLKLHEMSREQLLVIAAAMISDELALETVDQAAAIGPQDAVATAPPRLSIIGSDVISDAKTGLQWTRAPLGKPMNFSSAQKSCAECSIGGHKDWRLPTIDELLSIVDRSRHSPAMDTEFFHCEGVWYWSSTPLASSPSDYAWIVNFSNGYASYSGHDYFGFVRAVRASQ